MFEFGYTSDPGKVRKANEDSFTVSEEKENAYVLVCDGMGGHNAGDVASSTTVEIITKSLENKKSLDVKNLRIAIEDANSEVFRRAVMKEGCKGMGTTLVLSAFDKSDMLIANVGDSRAYHFDAQNSALVQITRDHSLLYEMLDSNQISKEQAEIFPYKNIITRAIGTKRVVKPDFFEKRWIPGDSLLLCSDGLNVHVLDSEIQEMLTNMQSPEVACQNLVDLALQRGGTDNITIVIVKNMHGGDGL